MTQRKRSRPVRKHTIFDPVETPPFRRMLFKALDNANATKKAQVKKKK